MNASVTDFRGTLGFALTDPSGEPVETGAQALEIQAGPWERTEVQFSVPVKAPRKWDAEHPNLYKLTLKLKSGRRTVQKLVQRIGFRQTEVAGSEILINGKPVKIRGSCHHDAHPTMGRAVTAQVTRQDLELMKEANLNALRTSHYPPIPELLDCADELGVYVEDESSFCWVGVSNDLRYTPRIMQLNAEMLARDRNHPSVIMWSICNESGFGYGFQRSHEWVKREDPTRPNVATWLREPLDIDVLHNPITVERIEENEGLGKPLIFDEAWCIFQGIFGDVAEMWVDPGMRDYYAEPLRPIWEKLITSKTTQGSQIWCWADDIFCVPNRGLEYGRATTQCHFLENSYRLPGRGIVGDAPWGVIDGWRRKKPEFWIIKKLHSPVKVNEQPLAMPGAGQPLVVHVKNEYDFADLSELGITWELAGEKGTAQASVAPRSSGEIDILPRSVPAGGAILTLSFTDAAGRLVDTYAVPVGPTSATAPPAGESVTIPLRIRNERSLAGETTNIFGRDFELAFDRGAGYLRRAVGFGQALLLEFPALHVLPTRTPMSPLPDRLSWRLKKLELRQEGVNIRVLIEGRYRSFDGGYDILVTPDAIMTVRSSFEYTGKDMRAREIGIRFSVPLDCDLLKWDRNAEWNVYPKDHIGMPRGEARAFAKHGDGLPPKWDWSQDNSPMGSNDFRSTKRHVNWASIGYPEGPGVVVDCGGTKHVRAYVEAERISLIVNDYFGGTNVGWGEWTSNYGTGRLVKKGDRLESTLRLRIVPGAIASPRSRSPDPSGSRMASAMMTTIDAGDAW